MHESMESRLIGGVRLKSSSKQKVKERREKFLPPVKMLPSIYQL